VAMATTRATYFIDNLPKVMGILKVIVESTS
jgi:hypothetical protein